MKELSMDGTSDTVKELPTRVRIWTNYKFRGEPGKCVWIKSLPICPRVTCKWSCTTKHSTRVDRDKTSSKSTRTRYEQYEQETLDLFLEVHTQRCYVSVEKGFKRRRSRITMLLTQGRDHLSSPRSLTMSSSERNGDYKLPGAHTCERTLHGRRLTV